MGRVHGEAGAADQAGEVILCERYQLCTNGVVEQMYIHYGCKEFLKSKFREIKNINFTKPLGGLWASDVAAENGWKTWCEDNDFRENTEENAFYFNLAPEANVLHIRSLKDLNGLPVNRDRKSWFLTAVCLDFEALKKSGYDAIELHLSNDYRLYWAMYGWDCDSILIMNSDVVEEVTP